MIEILISLAIFSIIIFSLNKYILTIYNTKKYLNDDIKNLENEMYFLDSLIYDISLRDINFDILNNDIYVSNNILMYMKDKNIIKYEFKDKNVLVSNRLENEKYFKRKLKVISCEDLLFLKKDNKLFIYLKNKGKNIKRVLNL